MFPLPLCDELNTCLSSESLSLLSSRYSHHKGYQSEVISFLFHNNLVKKPHLWLTETSWPIPVFAYRWETGSRYWWHYTITTTESIIHCSSSLRKENTDYRNVSLKCTCEIYLCSETVSHVTSCKLFSFNIHVRYIEVLQLYHMSLHAKYSVSIYMWDILMFWICITCHYMYNILFQYTCEIYWCSETVSHVTPCTIFCFSMHVRYTDVLKLYRMSLHVQYSFQYICEIYWCSETVSHITPCTIFCFNIHVRFTDVLKLYHMSLHVQYSVSVHMWDILKFWNCITCHYMYNILFQYTCEIYWCCETVSHITPCIIFCFNIHVRYTDVLKLYHMSLHVQYSVSIYNWDLLMLWNSITCHSM